MIKYSARYISNNFILIISANISIKLIFYIYKNLYIIYLALNLVKNLLIYYLNLNTYFNLNIFCFINNLLYLQI